MSTAEKIRFAIYALIALCITIFSIVYKINYQKYQQAVHTQQNTIHIEVSEIIRPYSNFPRIIYLGMPNENTFAIAPEGSGACPVYYPTSTKKFRFINQIFQLEKVTPEHIEFTFVETLH